jgi:hypothetical protein
VTLIVKVKYGILFLQENFKVYFLLQYSFSDVFDFIDRNIRAWSQWLLLQSENNDTHDYLLQGISSYLQIVHIEVVILQAAKNGRVRKRQNAIS